MADKRTVELWGLNDFFGAIVPAPTGVIWTNQTSGISCQHPEVEGYYLPLPHSILGAGDAFRLINVGYGDEAYDAALVQDFLEKNELTGLFEPAPETQHPFHEAWVPVRIKTVLENVPRSTSFVDVALSGHAGLEVILVYENSD